MCIRDRAIYNKLQANTVQTARIKDVVDGLGQTEYDRAESFLREVLKGGQVSAVELMQRADDDGIKRSELMKAKAKMDEMCIRDRENPVNIIDFRVYVTTGQAAALKHFLKTNGIRFEPVPKQ